MGIKSIARSIVPASAWNHLRRIKGQWVARQFQERRIQAVFHGFKLDLNIADPMSFDWYSPGMSNYTEISLLQSGKLKPGACVYDIGAHQGVVALVLSRIVGEKGHAVAVEANPFHARMAEKNVVSNDAKNLTVVRSAVADKPGTMRFSDDWGGQSPDALGVDVDVITLDSLTEKFGVPDVVFIDVEGFEQKVLEGGAKTLAAAPDLFIEMHLDGQIQEQGGSLSQVLSHLSLDRYTLFGLDPHLEKTPEGMTPVPLAEASFTDRRFFLIARAKA